MKKKQSTGKNNFNLYRQANSPNYWVRIRYKGRRRAFSTGESSIKAARSKAIAMMADIKSRGFDEAITRHGRRKEEKKTPVSDPTISQFTEIYRKAVPTFERRPSPPSIDYYIRCFQRICDATHSENLSQLTTQRIDLFRASYLSEGARAAREENRVRTSLNSIFRNAKALFSREAMTAYQKAGFDFPSPFAAVHPHRVEIAPYSPQERSLLDSIWRDAPLLRNGDPDATAPEDRKAGKSKARRQEVGSEKYARVNFRLPNPGAYLLLLLELGLGLRRNEADKAEWSWIYEKEGRWFMEIRDTPFFRPKSRGRRILPLEPDLHNELVQFRGESRFIVPGRELQKEESLKTLGRRAAYRAERHHRTLALWLRQKGINDGKPCHLLRKEFGSYVATSLGLFYAQRLLGHSTPVVTDAYYAGLTDIPELKTVQLSRKGQPITDSSPVSV